MLSTILNFCIGVDNPQLNIHSIREPGGMDDIKHSTGLLRIGF